MSLLEELHKPDILDCISNLSSDEVFTPPKLVNEVLDVLPQELFTNPDTKFLDPCCKTGIFLREIAKRLLVGLEDKIPDKNERIKHILEKQLFGIAITYLTAQVSRRTVYCSKDARNEKYKHFGFDTKDGNIWFDEKIGHFWFQKKCTACGASKDQWDRDKGQETHAYNFIHCNEMQNKDLFKRLKDMKFDVIIGNPPYQLNDGGGTGSSATPLYQKFVEQAIKLNPRYISMIIPARWYAGGKGLDDFRTKMLKSSQMKCLVDYANSADCFPGVTIAGGICYFLWEQNYTGKCKVINKKQNEIINEDIRALNEFPVFVRDNIAVGILRKVLNLKEKTMDELVFSRNCFNLFSNETGHTNQEKDDCILFSLKGKSYISKKDVADRDKVLSKYKVIMTKAMSGGNKPTADGNYLIVSSLNILNPNEVCTETYLCIGAFDNEKSALSLYSYVKTKFFRFLLLQCLTSINISKDKFMFIPIQDFSQEWTDEKLYKKYNLTDAETAFIESMIKPMG